MRRVLSVLVGGVFLVTACKGNVGPELSTASTRGQSLSVPDGTGLREVPGAGSLRAGQYFLHADTTLRLTPSGDATAPDPNHKGEMSNNWVGDLFRGTLLAVSRCEGGWCAVKHTRGGAEGWVPAATLVPEQGAWLATVLADTDTLDPQSGAVLPQKVDAGNLMVAVESRGEITRVATGTGSFAWVKTSALTDKEDEVRVAFLVVKAQHALEQGIPGDLKESFDMARVKLKDAKLLPILERTIPVNEINHGPPAFSLANEDQRP